MKYWFIDQHRCTHGVQKMCLVIGASRSGYYGWKRQPQSKRQRENEKILMEIRESHKNSHRAYGIPGKAKKKFKATTNSKHNLPVAENLLKQNFAAEKPNTVWVSDITYIGT